MLSISATQVYHKPHAVAFAHSQKDGRGRATQELPDECNARWMIIWLIHPSLTLLYGTLFTAKALYPDAAVAERIAVRVEGMECGLRGVQDGP